MSQILNCAGCNRPEEKDDNVASFKCGLCSCIGAARAQHNEEQRLGVYTKAMSKKARRSHKWTQKDLAFHLKIAVSHVSEFERGAGLIDPVHAAWLDEQ